ncbi:MAG: disulfide bond formation protein B [Pseudomonadota bacterium]
MRYRTAHLLAAVACAGLLGYAYYLEYVKYLDPCPLCMVQRLVFYALGAGFLISGLHSPAGRPGRAVYGLLLTAFGGLGIATAARHIWLQGLPPDEVPDCSPSLDYMLDNFPLAETWDKLLNASGDCATIDWTFLGVSMPGWTLVWFAGFTLWALFWGLRRPHKERNIFR